MEFDLMSKDERNQVRCSFCLSLEWRERAASGKWRCLRWRGSLPICWLPMWRWCWGWWSWASPCWRCKIAGNRSGSGTSSRCPWSLMPWVFFCLSSVCSPMRRHLHFWPSPSRWRSCWKSPDTKRIRGVTVGLLLFFVASFRLKAAK